MTFFQDSAQWTYQTFETFEQGWQFRYSFTHQYSLNGDTVISGQKYFKLFTTIKTVRDPLQYWLPPTTTYYEQIGPQYIRHDSLSNQVFFLEHPDSSIQLLYDFNLTVGDTVPLKSTFGYLTIDSISQKVIFGRSVKVFYLAVPASIGENFIIEGLGGYNGLIFTQPIFGAVSGGFDMTSLDCFQLGDSVYPSGISCATLDIPTDATEPKQNHEPEFFPNPTRDFLFIKNLSHENGSKVNIYSAAGQLLLTTTQTKIPVSHLAKGLYFVRVGLSNGESVVRKVVIQ